MKKNYENLAEEYLNKNQNLIFNNGDFFLYNDKNNFVYQSNFLVTVGRFFTGQDLTRTELNKIIHHLLIKSSVDGAIPFFADEPARRRTDIITFNNILIDTSNDKKIKHSPNWINTGILPFNYPLEINSPNYKHFMDMWLHAPQDVSLHRFVFNITRTYYDISEKTLAKYLII